MSRNPPGVSPNVFARTLNAGLRVRTNLSNAQRLTTTPVVGDVILTSDTNTYWAGDGATAGGVASATGLTNAQATRLGVIQPRCHDLLSRLRSATVGFKGLACGNSIVQGTGASTSTAAWVYQLGIALQAQSAVGVANDWAPTNVGVGGSQIVVPMGYAADYLNPAGVVTAGALRATKYPYGLLMTLRNDVTTSSTIFNTRARTLVRAMLALCEDVVVVSENPQINFSTGAVLDTGNWTNVNTIMQEVAADYGCTYVDVWAKWMLEYQAGADLRLRMSDGTHPNDLGHAMIAALVKQALYTPPAQRSAAVRDRGGTDVGQILMPLASYTPVAADVSTSTFSGLATATTARKVQLAEGSNLCYALANTQTAQFDCPLPIYRVRPVVVQGNSAGGTVTIDGTSLGAFSASAGGALEFPASTFTPATPSPGVVVVTSTNTVTGGLRLLGVQYDTPEALDQHPTWPGGTESGTWADATFAATGMASGTAGRSSSTVGDYIDITWYGTYLTFALETGTDRGKLSETTDGGATTTHDGYAATASYLYRCTPVQPVGWHTTRLTVATKNASSSANLTAVGLYKTCIPPDASTAYIAIAAGETMQLHGKWRLATLERALTGAPYVSGWTPSATAVVAAGTGTAIVRLQR